MESRGRVVVIYLTGQGAVSPAVGTGQAAPFETLSRASQSVSATVNSAAANVMFLGLTPGFIGLAQANIVIPDSARSGDNDVIITVGDQKSNSATISVR